MTQLPLAHWLVLLSVVISIAGAWAYIRDTVSGKTKPNLVSWSMWALAPLIGTAAAYASDADGWALIRTFLAGFLPLLVVISSFFNPKSYWEPSRFDILCGIFSALALGVWIAIDSPRTAILFAATADGFASIPTILKAWRYPETETGLSYLASLMSVVLVLPSITVWNIENCSFQVYLLVVNICLTVAVYRRRIFR